MKKALLIASVLFIAVISTACINNIAVQELNNKAAEFMQKGDYESAVNRLQASIDLDSTMYETYYNLGIAATNAKKYDVAIDAFEQGMKIKSGYPNFYYSLAIAQSTYADELADEDSSFNEVKDDEEARKELIEANKKKALELKAAAIINLDKYLELAPNAEDKETVNSLIEDCKNYVNPTKEEETKILVE